MRNIHTKQSTNVQNHLAQFYSDTITELEQCITDNDVVVIGMATNPHVKKALKILKKHNITYTYREYGGYLSAWNQRLAIKMWSGWPTFPQIFVRGTLIGGASDTITALKDGTFEDLQNE
tara:strand:+ start:342 stop:701 length:360 start_codon:yes stop_codon:yes gene_type:complete